MKTRQRRVLLLALVVALLLLVLSQALQIDRYRGPISSLVEHFTGGEVAVKHLAWGIDQGLWLKIEGLSIAGASSPPIDLALEQGYVRVALKPLLRARLIIEALEVITPELTYRLTPPASEIALPDTTAEPASAPMPFSLALKDLRISDGTLLVFDTRSVPGRTLRNGLHHLTLVLQDLAPRQTSHWQASANTGERGQLLVEGSFRGLTTDFDLIDPLLQVQARIKDIEVDGLDAYLFNPALEHALSGQLSAHLDYQGNLDNQGSVSAGLNLGRLLYSDPKLSEQPLPGGPLELTLQGQVAGDDFDIAALRLQSGPAHAEARGTIADWRQRPQLEDASADAVLPLAALRPLLPWQALGAAAGYLRDLTEGPGILTLTQATFPATSLTEAVIWPAWLNQVDAELILEQVSLRASPELPRIDALAGALRLQQGTLTGWDLRGRMGPLTTPTLRFDASPLDRTAMIQASLDGPLRLAPSADPQVAALLRRYQLENLTIAGDLDLQLGINLEQPSAWRGRGHILIDDLVLETLKGDGFSAEGAIHLRRRESLDLLLTDISGRLNHSPFQLAGALYDIDSPDRLADLQVNVRDLKLGRLEQWVPALASYQLGGRLSAELDIYYRQSAPQLSHARGHVSAHGLGLVLPAADLTLRHGRGDIDLQNERLELTQLSGLINQQYLALEGELLTGAAPRLRLQLTSPSLDFDRLLPPLPEQDTANPAPQQEASNAKIAARELPAWASNAEASVNVDIAQGQLRQVGFTGLTLRSHYRQRQLDRLELAVQLPEGRLQAKASADLSHLEAIPFRLQHNIERADLANLTRLNSGEERATGQLDSQGDIRANSADLLNSMEGQVNIQAGPGVIANRSAIANTLFSILSIINVQGIIQGNIGAEVISEGLPYDSLLVDAHLTPGKVGVKRIDLISPAFSTRAVGEVDLQASALRFDAVITVLGMFDKLLAVVPLVGQSVADLTKVYLRISGPFEGPQVTVQPEQALTTSLGNILDLPFYTKDPEER